MTITIIYYGQARDMAEVEKEDVTVDEPAVLSDVVQKAVMARGEALQKIILTQEGRIRESVLVSVNDEVAGASAVLKDGDEISLFTAVAGG